MDIEVDEENCLLKCQNGRLDFSLDEETISVFQIFASEERQGIGSSLVTRLEGFAVERRLKNVVVPVTPSKQALSFWLKMGYEYVWQEDKILGDEILGNQDCKRIINTGSGIILLRKKIEI
jgi:GNAT superfamily N-acetyltransferase